MKILRDLNNSDLDISQKSEKDLARRERRKRRKKGHHLYEQKKKAIENKVVQEQIEQSKKERGLA